MANPLSGKPEKFFMAAGAAEGPTELNAFDNALLKAGIGNYNLLKVSSIIPPDSRKVDSVDLPAGSLLPIAYGSVCSSEPGRLISAAVAVGLPNDRGCVGIIAEIAGEFDEDYARQRARFMAEQALIARGCEIKEILVISSSIEVVGPSCAFAGVAVW